MKGVRKLVAMGLIMSSLFMVIGCESANERIEDLGHTAAGIIPDLPLSEKGSSEMLGHKDGMMWAESSSFTTRDVVELFIIQERSETLIAKDYFSAVLEHVSFYGMEDSESLEVLLEGYEYYTEYPEELENNN